MRFRILTFSALILLAPLSMLAQQSCELCHMDIISVKFKAKATLPNNNVVQFDAIECLVNYLKVIKTTENFVTDYKSGDWVNAEDAFFLKSKELPSPMGANLSAYQSKDAAIKQRDKLEGEVFNWIELQQRFEKSRFGAVGHHHHNRPDMYAPSGVMGDHLHEKGGLMISFRTMDMTMDGLIEGTDELPLNKALEMYMMAPNSMNMDMYMLGVMYAPSNRITLTAMQNYRSNKMSGTMKMMMPMAMTHGFETSSGGLGDLHVQALIGILSNHASSLHLNTGVSVPFGSITEMDAPDNKEERQLAYAMQLGSGTVDPSFGFTYRGNLDKISWGAQEISTLRLYKNSRDYHLGDIHQVTSWFAYVINQNISTSVRADFQVQGPISGKDSDVNPMMSPTGKGSSYQRQIASAYIGTNALLFNNHILVTAEYGMPFFQWTAGIFMQSVQNLNASLRYIF